MDYYSDSKAPLLPDPASHAALTARRRRVGLGIVISLSALVSLALHCHFGPPLWPTRLFPLDRHSHSRSGYSAHTFDPTLVDKFLAIPEPESARQVSHAFTRETHIAGTEGDRKSALRVKTHWEHLLGVSPTSDDHVFDAGTRRDRLALTGHGHGHGDRHPRVWVSTYYPYLNYPVRQSLTLTPPANSSRAAFSASLTERVVPEDPTSANGVATFHGFSKNGTARGPLVYAGFGRTADYARLAAEGVDVQGKVVIVQYGGTFRGLKVKAAAEAGAVACVIYSDPAADGAVTEEHGLVAYPAGPARAPSSVQRGSVQYLSVRPGDPLTPFEPAYNPELAGAPDRLELDDPSLNVPTIPSLPISYEDAVPLLKSLNGHGTRREDRPGWREGGLRYQGVEYFTGPGPDQVEVVNEVEDRKTTPVWNTMAIIPGEIDDEIVVIGNHNDAWTFGAGDPNSGTASMSETVRAFGELLAKGDWKPFRTILLASWDAEEYGLIGSTEFGEDFTDYLRERVVAYLNLDVSVSGSSFELASSPSLSHLLQECAGMVKDPTAKTIERQDLGQTKVKTLGSGSDFSVFLQYIGVAAGNLGFSGAVGDPVYHYHSNYDSFYWMEKFGDPTFERHVVVSKILGLTALRLVQDLVLPLNTTAYALELETYLTKVVNLPSYPGREQLDLTLLGSRLSTLVEASRKVDARANLLVEQLEQQQQHSCGGKERRRRKHRILRELREINRKKRSFESTLLVPPGEPGLVGREWYKSLVVAPGRWLGYGATTLPGLTEALELDGDVDQAEKEVARLEQAIERAIKLLRA
ncbi:hypothetical protein JCM11491_003110 [Sporobolomyces phaffii]